MDAVVRWLVVAISMLIISNNCLARKLDEVERGRSKISVSVASNNVVLDNGIFQLTISNPFGFVSGIRYKGIDNLLEIRNKEPDRGYFDVAWDAPGRCGGCTDGVPGATFSVVRNTSDRTEVSFASKWNQSSWNDKFPRAPLNVDRRYIVFKGFAGYYSYTILEHEKGFPEASLHQIRAVYKLSSERFQYMAISDDRQRLMPTPEDRTNGEVLAFKEAVHLVNPVNPNMKGEVDDKYQYSCEDRENKLHGWIGSNPMVGFWLISPSDEFRSAGPFKQDLTSHVGPTCLQMFHSSHYAGNMALAFKKGEAWKKVFGPFLVYLNSNKKHSDLWQDAKRQLAAETKRWPYVFAMSKDFAKHGDRGSVSGRLLMKDRYAKKSVIPANKGWVGLAAVGEVGSWQLETKGYQFWVMTSENGNFVINNVLQGTYNLYATVSGYIGDYKYTTNIRIGPGKEVKLGDITYEPPRHGPTMWEIGIPDRTASEFFIPDPNPNLVNKLFLNKPQHKFRQYGLWDQYTKSYPKMDLVYTVGKSDFRKDWFFAHVPRLVGENKYAPTTWRIVFPVSKVEASTTYMLSIAIAAASNAEVQVRFNDPAMTRPHFTTKLFGKDNAIARHGIHGLYNLFSLKVPSSWLHSGSNTIYLTQARCKGPFDGVMYDYIRLEGPP